MWFLKSRKTHHGKFKRQRFKPYRIQYYLPNNIVFLVMVNKFDTHPILVNVNKLKPYQLSAISQGWESKVQGGQDLDEQPKWNEDDQLEVEDDTQLEADSHSIIVPLEQFFNNEPKLNEVQVTSKKQPQIHGMFHPFISSRWLLQKVCQKWGYLHKVLDELAIIGG